MALFALFVLLHLMENWKHSCWSSVISMNSCSPQYPRFSMTPLNPFPPPLFPFSFLSFSFFFHLFFPSLPSLFFSSFPPPTPLCRCALWHQSTHLQTHSLRFVHMRSCMRSLFRSVGDEGGLVHLVDAGHLLLGVGGSFWYWQRERWEYCLCLLYFVTRVGVYVGVCGCIQMIYIWYIYINTYIHLYIYDIYI